MNTLGNVDPIKRHEDDSALLANLRDVQPKDQQKVGWLSPCYAVSRSVDLKPEVLRQNRCVLFGGSGPEINAYRILRAQISRRSERGKGSAVMVTSAVSGEGKTLTSINLALAIAKEFCQTSILVDCDLRQQHIHKVLGYTSNKGLSDYFCAGEPLSNIIVWPGIEKLTVISGGTAIEETSELLGSPGMKDLIEEMKLRYPERTVVCDTPAVLAGADAIALSSHVDGIVMVIQAEHTSAPEVEKAVRLLPQDKIIGFVLNRVKEGDARLT